MNLNNLAKESLENVKRRSGHVPSIDQFEGKINEEVREWTQATGNKSKHCHELTEDEEETADVIFVMLTYSASMGYDIEKILKVKHEFNLKRND